MRSHSIIDGHRLQHGCPLRDLRGRHVVLLHVLELVQLNQVLLALSRWGLTTRHGKLHLSIRIVYEVELVLIRGDIYVVVHTTVYSAHLVHARVEVCVVAGSECSVGGVQRGFTRCKEVELLHLSWGWDDHVLSWLLGSLVVMVVMVVVHVTEVWVDEAISLDLSGGLVVEMLLGLVHALVVTAVTLGFGAVVLMTAFGVLMLFYFFLFEFLGFFLLFHCHN